MAGLKPFLSALGLALVVSAAPIHAAPNAQLVQSVENRLAVIGMRDVDVSGLSTSQIAALHLKLQGNYDSFLRRVRTQQEVKVILGWDS